MLICKSYAASDPSSVIVIKKDSLNNIAWSKKINPANPYTQLVLYAVAEAANGNIAVAGQLAINSTTENMYRLILSPDGVTLTEDIVSSPIVTSQQIGVHAICRLSSDSLLFIYSLQNITVSGVLYEGLFIVTSDNTGNNGNSTFLLMQRSPNESTQFSSALVSGNKLKLYGHGYSTACNVSSNDRGTFVSIQYDMSTRNVDYFKTYCLPRAAYGNYEGSYNWNSITHLPSRTFHLENGHVAMVRPYMGILPAPLNGFAPMLISYFDSNFNLLNSTYLKSNLLLPRPVINDLLITPEGIQHFNFADFNRKQVYYAVADAGNQFLLQKKMPFPSGFDWGNTYGTQLPGQGSFTGFTFNSISNNQGYINYVQIRPEDTAASCFGTDTSFLSFLPAVVSAVPSSTVTVLPATATSEPLNFPMVNFPMVREELCMFKTICDSIAIRGPSLICDVTDPVIFTAYKNPLCPGKVNFIFDTSQVQSYEQVDDTSIRLTFNANYKGYIYARSANCCQLTDSLEVIFMAEPVPLDLGADIPFCPGKRYQISAYHPGYKTYQWQDGSTNDNYIATSAGTYTVTVTDFCGRAFYDSIKVTPKDFQVDLGKDSTICLHESIQLSVSPGFLHYNWQPADLVSYHTPNSVVVSPKTNLSFTVEAEVFAGCYLSDSIHIRVQSCPEYIYYPNSFTPNNDGLNETFKPLVSGALERYDLQIYNRWGQLVFRTANKHEGWAGKFKGLQQETSVFVWQCRYKFYGKPEKLSKGTVTIIR